MYGLDWNEPAPAQVVHGGAASGRYRVGDRVRVVKDGHEKGGSGHGADIGEVTTIKEAVDSDFVIGDSGWAFIPHEIAPAFRPGDRVKLNKHSGVRACGERGTVSAVIGDNVSVRMDDASAYGTVVAFFHADNLNWERVEDCKASAAPEPKFKAGDVVTYKTDRNVRRTIARYKEVYGRPAYEYVDSGFDYEDSLELAAPRPQDNEQPGDPLWRVHIDTSGYVSGVSIPQPCIVALISNGKPRPSSYPHVHASVEAATKEAERLARNNPGQEFAVYQRVTARVAEVQMKEVA